jgi:HAD superfamily hydrolase (TIGR01509 family)
MTMNNRYQSWLDVAALDEHLTVFLKLDEALERFLADSASFSREPYKISTGSGSVERMSRAQISDAVDSLGGSLNVLEVWYACPGCRVSLDARPFAAYPDYRIGCQLNVFGDDEQEYNGRFDTLRNRMDAEIKRQFPPSIPVKQGTQPSAAQPAAAQLNAYYLEHRFDNVELFPEVVDALAVLSRSYVLGLLSNGNGYPERSGLGGPFAAVVFSQDHGVEKPDRWLFDVAAAEVGCGPHEVVMVGDSLPNDVRGAQNAGWRAIWLSRDGRDRPDRYTPDAEISNLVELPKALRALQTLPTTPDAKP